MSTPSSSIGAGRRCVEQREHVHERGLAGAALADDRDALALADVEAHAPSARRTGSGRGRTTCGRPVTEMIGRHGALMVSPVWAVCSGTPPDSRRRPSDASPAGGHLAYCDRGTAACRVRRTRRARFAADWAHDPHDAGSTGCRDPHPRLPRGSAMWSPRSSSSPAAFMPVPRRGVPAEQATRVCARDRRRPRSSCRSVAAGPSPVLAACLACYGVAAASRAPLAPGVVLAAAHRDVRGRRRASARRTTSSSRPSRDGRRRRCSACSRRSAGLRSADVPVRGHGRVRRGRRRRDAARGASTSTAITERAERAEQTREAEAQRRVTEERLRIARDLHDAVAHQISVISLNAGVASTSLESRPEKARGGARDDPRGVADGARRDRRPARGAAQRRRTTLAHGARGRAAAGLDRLDELVAAVRRRRASTSATRRRGRRSRSSDRRRTRSPTASSRRG